MSTQQSGGRLRAYSQFFIALLYFFLARSLARHAAQGLASEQWEPLLEQAMLVFLLLLGYTGLGFSFARQAHPISSQGLPRRQGWPTEAGLGMAVGWSLALACVIPLALFGGIALSITPEPSAWGWLAADTAFFALVALAEEVAFRGYGFQRLIQAVGPLGATLGFAVFYALFQAVALGWSSRASIIVSLTLSLLLTTAYLRTRALWVSWGLNFGWKASRALLFGLTVSGINSHSPVVQGDPMGPFWLTGGGYGLDGSWIAFLILLAAFPVVFRVTRDLDYQYNAPVIVPGGIPVDLDAAGRRQHEAATRTSEPAAPGLVQIIPVSSPLQPIQPNQAADRTSEL
jgi:hypothetical protein